MSQRVLWIHSSNCLIELTGVNTHTERQKQRLCTSVKHILLLLSKQMRKKTEVYSDLNI